MSNPTIKSFLSLAIAKSRTSSELSTSSEETDYINKISQQQIEDTQRLEAERQGWKEIHGFRGNCNWSCPLRLKKGINEEGHAVKHTKNNDYEDE